AVAALVSHRLPAPAASALREPGQSAPAYWSDSRPTNASSPHPEAGSNTAEGYLCFLSPRRRSGERTEERGIQGPSSLRPSPPSDGGEGVSLVTTGPGWEGSRVALGVRTFGVGGVAAFILLVGGVEIC